ncbi:cysteinyl leukotriene receptor 1-like isoform X2 [Eleginops maclovinus]|uniref:cysteinyl leukotriene receptor 1-like isoform X2 n=1 Tax=Eleginops maclovinus TaxID=56733 RepID=UPI00308016FF
MESNLTHMEGNFTNCPSIDDFRNQVYSTSYSLITVLGLVGNGLALVVLIRTYRQSSPFHIYMLNLGVSDLLYVMTLPLRVVYYVKKGQWSFGDFLCRISSYALYVNLYCSIYFMAAMSFTRFLAIVFPVQNMQLVTEFRSKLVCVCIWILICLLSSPFLITVRALMSRNHAARRQRVTDTRVIRMIVIVLLTFLISFMPYHVQRTIHLNAITRDCSEKVALQKSVVVTQCLAAANSCFDPLLYFFSGEGFRSRLSSMKRSMKNSTQNRIAKMKTTTDLQIVENHQLNAS